jgi:hypothetical protein
VQVDERFQRIARDKHLFKKTARFLANLKIVKKKPEKRGEYPNHIPWVEGSFKNAHAYVLR